MQESNKIKIICTAVLCIAMNLLTIGFVEALIRWDAEHEERLLRDTLLNTGSIIGQEIQRKISDGRVLTESLHALLKATDYNTADFQEWAELLVQEKNGSSVVQLAKKGIVSNIYPLSGHEKALGHNLLADAQRSAGAVRALRSGKVTFVGPLKLIQNGAYAVIARKPVFRVANGIKEFWGFTIAILSVDQILPERIRRLEEQGLYIALEGDNPDSKNRPVLFASKGHKSATAVDMDIQVPNGVWKLQLGYDPIENKYYGLARIFTILFSFIISAFIFIQQCMVSVKQEQITFLNERLTKLSLKDDLTDIGNRRAGMQALEEHIQHATMHNEKLSVLMFDLDLFKQVNDQYGHPAGDSILKHSAFCLNAAVRQTDSVFRIGGDEFLMLFPETDTAGAVSGARKVQAFLDKMPVTYDGEELSVSSSIGIAEYREGETMESLLNRVDMKLYEAKESGRNTICF